MGEHRSTSLRFRAGFLVHGGSTPDGDDMATGKEPSSAKTSPIEIDLLVMLRRRWPQLAFGTVVGIALALIYSFSTTSMYESDIEILVGRRSSEVTNNGTINGANANGDAIQEDQLATHMRLFVGRKMLADAVKNSQLDELASFRAAAESGESPVDYILRHIEVGRGGEGDASDAMVLRASFRDPNPDDAAYVLSAIFGSYQSYVESHGQNSTEQAVELIEEARKSHEIELDLADKAYRDFVNSVPVLIEGEVVQDIHKDRLANIEPELNRVRTSLAEATSRLEIIDSYLEKSGDEPLGDMDHLALLSQTEVERLKLFLDMTRGETQSEAFQAEQPVRQEVAKAQYNRLLDLIQKEKSFSDAFGPGHPLVEAVRKETAITRQFIEANMPVMTAQPSKQISPAEMLKTYTRLLRNDITEYEKRKALLLKESSEELRLAKKVESDYLKGASLKAKLSRAQSRYDQVLLRLQELNLARSYAGFSTDVLAHPEPAKNASWPHIPLLLALGCFLGTGLGLGLAVGAEMVDSTFKSVQELEQSVGAPAIAHVPRFHPGALISNANPDSEMDASVVTFHAPRSSESEVYRVARTSLMIANRKDSLQTLMMTSPQPGDGKSTTISNLAVSFARTGKRVLLIDADMRRPMISNLFGIESETGLADVLEGASTLARAVVPTDVTGLDVMPHGMPTSSPAELLESHRLSKLLQDARRQYDLVLIDAPPLLAVADPAIIAPIVDSVILTVRVNKNGRRPVEHAVRMLEDIEVPVGAVIVNGVDNDVKAAYGYGAYAKDHYGYVGRYHDRYSSKEVEDRKPSTLPPPHDKRERPRARAASPTCAVEIPNSISSPNSVH